MAFANEDNSRPVVCPSEAMPMPNHAQNSARNHQWYVRLRAPMTVMCDSDCCLHHDDRVRSVRRVSSHADGRHSMFPTGRPYHNDMSGPRHTIHYTRVGGLLAVGLLVFFVVRSFLIPPSFGQYGAYRGDNVEEQMEHPMRFAAKDLCSTCHGDIWEMHQQGKHAGVQCQNCHDVAGAHVHPETNEMVGAMPIQRTAQWCLRCHLQLPSRPTGFPQIDPVTHADIGPGALQSDKCLQCHVPHDPTRMPSEDGKKERPK